MEVISNFQLRTNEVRLKNNGIDGEEFAITPQFERRTGMEGDRYYTELVIRVENTDEQKSPIDLFVSITGLFDLPGKDKEYIDRFLKENAVQILFPYLRTIVSNSLTSAMYPPLIMPVINPLTLFPDNRGDPEATKA